MAALDFFLLIFLFVEFVCTGTYFGLSLILAQPAIVDPVSELTWQEFKFLFVRFFTFFFNSEIPVSAYLSASTARDSGPDE